MDSSKKIIQFKESFDSELSTVTTLEQLEAFRIKFLGRSGEMVSIMKLVKDAPIEEKRSLGPLLNQLKKNSESKFESKMVDLSSTDTRQLDSDFDVTAYQPGQPKGTLHPYTYLTEKIEDVFISMGYKVVDGPEIETDYYNFEALNIPKNHPARDMQDTFWLNIPDLLLRTHTSPVQIHELEKGGLPLAVIASGRCYRHEATDASHDFVFRQVEGLVVGKNLSIGNLIATMKEGLRKIFDRDDLDIKVRTSYFPFVEPAIEIDMRCPFCENGCSTCKHSQWIEIMGAGLVHPNVLKYSGIDSKKYNGFAFCFGLTRLVMLKYGINDIRLLNSGKIDFLKQFRN
jgi:phenylalanyl-tRNA synthetase alpha chain